ncbi:MAG: MBL fold metallo-hydrolase [Gammaproteobacteria bacterium]|nr:MBL fold metallo-hydrolase [Gammaproteobacteria bacterium]MCY4358568.1 MBL fold metallo-hydrolase [Gammaproteobacteria bacterium]
MTNFFASEPVALAEIDVPVFRILGRNPGPMTGPGTNSYLIGKEQLSLLDPGPRDLVQLQCFLRLIGKRKLRYILLTHTHGDHSPGAIPLAEATGAELVGMSAPDAPGQDQSFKPSRQWQHGDCLELGEYTLELVHTPGHVSNHICYLLRPDQLLFTGDHVLQGTTSVILPPDGNMSDYLNSLRLLQDIDLRYLAPGHGSLMSNPRKEIEGLIKHRMRRENKIVSVLSSLGNSTLDELVKDAYDDVSAHLIPWAKKTLLAHLIKLQKDGRAIEENTRWRLTESA